MWWRCKRLFLRLAFGLGMEGLRRGERLGAYRRHDGGRCLMHELQVEEVAVSGSGSRSGSVGK